MSIHKENNCVKVVKYEIRNHGVEHEQYFQGCGVAFTSFTHCYTGIGDSATEAFDDALEQASEDDWTDDALDIIGREGNKSFGDKSLTVLHEDDDRHYYVSLLIQGE